MNYTKSPAIQSFIRKLFILLIIIPLLYGCKPSGKDISFENYTGRFVEIKGFPRNGYGYIIYDIESEKIVKGHNINKEFTPASVTKIFTAFFAEDILGSEYTFQTDLLYDGNISDGDLNGNIYLRGGGDPELSIEGLHSLLNSLKSEKIKRINGRFYYDDFLFQVRESLDRDMPAEGYYNPGLSPLSLNSNMIYALQRRGTDGKIIRADMLPTLESFTAYIYNEKLPYPYMKYNYSKGKEIWGLPDRYLWDSRQSLPVKHPGLYTAQTFQKLCLIHGIKLPSPEQGQTSSSSKLIAVSSSRPLYEIIKSMLFSSSNVTAEMLWAASVKKYTGKYSGQSNSGHLIKKHLGESLPLINWENFLIINGSGLTDLNKATPAQTAAVLRYIDSAGKDNFMLEEILPLSGWNGTMKSRLDEPENSLRVYAKTGSIFYSSALAGIFYGKTGKKYIFTVYINNPEKRSEYSSKIEKTAEDLNNGGYWSKKAADAIDSFIALMISEL